VATRKQLEANITKIYLFNAIWMFMVIMPVIVVFFQSKGLSMADIFLLQSIFGIAMLLFELPSGYFSDLFGRKITLVVSTVFHGIGFCILPFANDFETLVVMEIFLALAVSLFSGTDVAILYDSLNAIGDRRAHVKIMGRKIYYQQLGETFGALAGGWLILISLECNVWGQAVVSWIPLCVVLTMVEPPRPKMSKRKHKDNFIYIYRSLFRQSRLLTLIILNSMMWGVATLLAVWTFQKYWQEINIPLLWFGYVWAACNLTVALVAKNAHKIEKSLGSPATIILMGILPVIGYFGMSFVEVWWGALFCLCFQASRGINSVILRDALNRRVSGDLRATANSVNSLGVRFIFIIFGPYIGSVIDQSGSSAAFNTLGIAYLVCFIIVLLPFLAQRKHFDPIPVKNK